MNLPFIKISTHGALFSAILLCSCNTSLGQERLGSAVHHQSSMIEKTLNIHYLEIVTSNVQETCSALAEVHDVEFGAPEPGFGNARIAVLKNGGRIGVRAPLSDAETPIVRPYMLVDNIEIAIAKAEASGAKFAMLATEIPGHGKFAIYFLDGIQYGLWEV